MLRVLLAVLLLFASLASASAAWTERLTQAKDENDPSVRGWHFITSSSDGTKLAATASVGNIWTSTDSGATWTERETQAAGESGPTKRAWRGIASSSDGTKLVAGVFGANIWTSTNSGETWTEVPGNMQNWWAFTSSSDGSKLAATAWPGGGKYGFIWTSTNYGATWNQKAINTGWRGITMSSDGTKLAAVVCCGGNGVTLNGIWTSTDSGNTWNEVPEVTPSTPSGTESWQGITMSSDGTKLAATAINGNIWTAVSSDSGWTWTERETWNEGESEPSVQNWREITMSSDGTKLAATIPSGSIWTSTNSGETWTEVKPSESEQIWYGITSSSDGTKVAIAVVNGNIWTYTAPPPPVPPPLSCCEEALAKYGFETGRELR